MLLHRKPPAGEMIPQCVLLGFLRQRRNALSTTQRIYPKWLTINQARVERTILESRTLNDRHSIASRRLRRTFRLACTLEAELTLAPDHEKSRACND